MMFFCSALGRLIEAPIFLPFLVLGPLQLLAVTALIWAEIGPAALGGGGLMALTAVVQFTASKQFQRIRRKTAHATDERVKTMNELVTGIRVVKM